LNARLKTNHVFVNCPFDPGYGPMFEAIVFCLHHLGFVARCAREDDDAGEVRLSKIERIIEECPFGINDLSAVELDASTGLPRFNMPLERGLFLGCKRFGAANQNRKRTLVLDREPYRYRAFISDIAGQDIRAHAGDPKRGIGEVRDWLRTTSKRASLPGAKEVIEHYRQFRADLPELCTALALDPDRLTFLDLSTLITDWLKTRP
jgi:hypothetical protein